MIPDEYVTAQEKSQDLSGGPLTLQGTLLMSTAPSSETRRATSTQDANLHSYIYKRY